MQPAELTLGSAVATLLTDIGSSFHKSNLSGWLGASYLLTVW